MYIQIPNILKEDISQFFVKHITVPILLLYVILSLRNKFFYVFSQLSSVWISISEMKNAKVKILKRRKHHHCVIKKKNDQEANNWSIINFNGAAYHSIFREERSVRFCGGSARKEQKKGRKTGKPLRDTRIAPFMVVYRVHHRALSPHVSQRINIIAKCYFFPFISINGDTV